MEEEVKEEKGEVWEGTERRGSRDEETEKLGMSLSV